MRLRSFIAFFMIILGAWTSHAWELRKCGRDKVIQAYLEDKNADLTGAYCDLVEINTKPTFSSAGKVELDFSVLYNGSSRSREEILKDPKFQAPRFKELAALLPKYATVTSSRDLDKQSLVADAILNILKTRYGRFLCTNYVNMGVSFLRTFGLKPETQKQAQKLCGTADAGAMTNIWNTTVFADDQTEAEFQKTAREYIFLVSKDFKEPVAGWTNSSGVTYLSINPRLITQQSFYELFIHETYMIGDAWSNIHGVFQMQDVIFDTDLNDWSTARLALANPYVMAAMASYRARIFETWVLWDLGFDVKPIRSLPQNCSQDIQAVKSDIERFSSVFQEFPKAMSLPEAMTYLDRHPKLCEKLYLPTIETAFLGGTSGQGPRPRIGGGWSGGGE